MKILLLKAKILPFKLEEKGGKKKKTPTLISNISPKPAYVTQLKWHCFETGDEEIRLFQH